ncbi:hypothetical protein [Actinomadura chokoriensis]|uniref:hypothetical protein n=1 Tax=Actinomadura chokoriensis TaxID=454156 RepID=UPI0031F92BEF
MAPVRKWARDRRRVARWAGFVALALYFVTVTVVGEWRLAVAGVAALCAGALCGMIAYAEGVQAWELMRAFPGGLVRAEYSETIKIHRPVGGRNPEAPFQQRYIYVNAEGRTLTGTHGCSYANSTARPLRRFWVAKGRHPGLRPFWQTLLSPAHLILAVPASLATIAFVLAAVPGALIAAIIGVPLG